MIGRCVLGPHPICRHSRPAHVLSRGRSVVRAAIAVAMAAGFHARPGEAECVSDSLYVAWAAHHSNASATASASEDFDRDGRADVAIVHSATRHVAVWRGRGDGTFERTALMRVGTSPVRVAVADFDRDGWQDLAVTDASRSVHFLPGSSTGFQSPRTIPLPHTPHDIVVGEFNGDGIPDAALIDITNGRLTVLLSDPQPFEFSVGSVATFVGAGALPTALASADLNGDTYLDLVVANRGTGSLTIVLGEGTSAGPTGRFGAPRTYHGVPSPRALAVTDVTGDGVRDLVYGSRDGVGYLKGLGSAGKPTGDFDGTLRFFSLAGADARDIEIADANRDGVADILAVAAGRGGLALFVGLEDGDQAAGSFATPVLFATGGVPATASMAEFSGDDDPDAFVAHEADTLIRVLVACRQAPDVPSVDPPPPAPDVQLAVPSAPDPGPRPEPAPWPAGGVPVCLAEGAPLDHQVASDHMHGAYFTWRDQRGGDWDIYAHRFGPDGHRVGGWPENGIVVCDAPGAQYQPRIVSDGPDGAWVAWTDERDGLATAYLQRLSPDGSIAEGWPVNGRSLFRVESGSLGVGSDLEGGIYLFWQEPFVSVFRSYRALHFGSSGLPRSGWPAEGLLVFEGYSYGGCAPSYNTLMTASLGWPEIIVLGSTHAIYMCESGCDFCWLRESGRQVQATQGLQPVEVVYSGYENTAPFADGRGGMILFPAPATVSRKGWFGHPSWSREVRTVSNRGIGDRTGGFFIHGFWFGGWGLLRLLEDGATFPGWPEEGVPACTGCVAQNGSSPAPDVVADGLGGAFLLWQDWRTATPEFHANWIRPNGTYGWGPEGARIVAAPIAVEQPVFASNGAGDLIAAWRDARDGEADLWATRISYDAPPAALSAARRIEAARAASAALAFAFEGATPNPAAGPLAIRFTLPRAGRADLRVTDIAGRIVHRASHELGAGPHQIELGARLAPGVYVIRLEFAGTPLTRRAVVVR